MFFKYATDVHGLYGSEFAAQKAASNELRAINAIIDQNLTELHITLTALFLIRGHAVCAIAICPIAGSATCVYGSPDAGKCVFACLRVCAASACDVSV